MKISGAKIIHQQFNNYRILYIIVYLLDRGDIFVKDFLSQDVKGEPLFKRMLEHGYFFIILDSFDEIPQVLDEGESSWLIDKLSEIIYKFLSGGHKSRGILASRIFRRPTDSFDADVILEIRPFKENIIITYLNELTYYNDDLINNLFTKRQELIPVARNPFTAALISSYAKDYVNQLPQNQTELYSNYIRKRLKSCKDKINTINRKQKIQIDIDKIIDSAKLIAYILFKEYGLEMPAKDIVERSHNTEIESIIEILVYARICRLGSGFDKKLSFVHRRFNEYFVVLNLIDNPAMIPRESIPTDSRWRDSLALFL